jgi:hypothetical protein
VGDDGPAVRWGCRLGGEQSRSKEEVKQRSKAAADTLRGHTAATYVTH